VAPNSDPAGARYADSRQRQPYVNRKIIVGIVCVSVMATSGAASLQAATSSPPSAADRIEWTAANADRLKAIFSDAASVASLDRQTAPPEDDAESDSIGDFRVVDLNNDGRLELVCLVDVTGRAWYTQLIIFSQQNHKMMRSAISSGGANIESLEKRVVDLDRDGKKQLLVPRWLEKYEGAGEPIATFTDVYRFDGQRAVQADHEFPDYYRKIELPRLQSDLNALTRLEEDAGIEATRQKKIAVIRREIDAILSSIGG
jgi:hypothetical protein